MSSQESSLFLQLSLHLFTDMHVGLETLRSEESSLVPAVVPVPLHGQVGLLTMSSEESSLVPAVVPVPLHGHVGLETLGSEVSSLVLAFLHELAPGLVG